MLITILAAAATAGLLATVAAGASLRLSAAWIPRLVSFAVGALLAAVFIELLPHALEIGHADTVMLTVLCGLLGFFLLEKLVLWRHSHGHETHDATADETEHDHALHAHGHEPGTRSGLMILVGNSVHNFCDGVVIAAAFMGGGTLGITATAAIVAHAIPQQVGDFAVLLHSGYTRPRAFAVNVATGLATIVGALAGWFALASVTAALPIVLAIASASLLYVAVADLIPGLHRRPEPLETLRQMLMIGLGIAVIAGAHFWLDH